MAAGLLVAGALAARDARAVGACDPEGHFCVQFDTTSASVCDLLRPGELDPDACSIRDVARRELVRGWKTRPFRALVIRFDDWWVFAMVTRIPVTGELAEGQLDAHAREVREHIGPHAWPIDTFAAPVMTRVHEVQAIRFDALGTVEGTPVEQVDVEVRAADASYDIAMQGPAGARLHAFADAATASIDAIPASRSTGPGTAISWLVRGLLIALVIAAAGWWIGKRRGRAAFDSRDLWPR